LIDLIAAGSLLPRNRGAGPLTAADRPPPSAWPPVWRSPYGRNHDYRKLAYQSRRSRRVTVTPAFPTSVICPPDSSWTSGDTRISEALRRPQLLRPLRNSCRQMTTNSRLSGRILIATALCADGGPRFSLEAGRPRQRPMKPPSAGWSRLLRPPTWRYGHRGRPPLYEPSGRHRCAWGAAASCPDAHNVRNRPAITPSAAVGFLRAARGLPSPCTYGDRPASGWTSACRPWPSA
jgi:hypothetical protein